MNIPLIAVSIIFIASFSGKANAEEFISSVHEDDIVCITTTQYEAPQNITVCQSVGHTGSGFAACVRVEKRVCKNTSTGKKYTVTDRYVTKHCVSVGLIHTAVQEECAGQ